MLSTEDRRRSGHSLVSPPSIDFNRPNGQERFSLYSMAVVSGDPPARLPVSSTTRVATSAGSRHPTRGYLAAPFERMDRVDDLIRDVQLEHQTLRTEVRKTRWFEIDP